LFTETLAYLDSIEYSVGENSAVFKYASSCYAAHPNLKVYEDFQGVIKLCTSDANEYVDNIEVEYRTDDGGSLLVAPFLLSKEGKLYSDPPYFVVGARNTKGFGVIPLNDWKSLLTDWNISDSVISKVKNYLGQHQRVDYDDPRNEEATAKNVDTRTGP
jgi:hypothetical protein